MAPRLMRFPEMPNAHMPTKTPSSANGMVIATTSPARTFTSITKSTTKTSTQASTRFFETVRTVRPTSSERS